MKNDGKLWLQMYSIIVSGLTLMQFMFNMNVTNISV